MTQYRILSPSNGRVTWSITWRDHPFGQSVVHSYWYSNKCGLYLVNLWLYDTWAVFDGLTINIKRINKWTNAWGFGPPFCTHAKLGQENLLSMVRWMRWHCPPDTGFEIRALMVWGRARYLSATEVPHNIESLRVSGEEISCFTTAPGPSPYQINKIIVGKLGYV